MIIKFIISIKDIIYIILWKLRFLISFSLYISCSWNPPAPSLWKFEMKNHTCWPTIRWRKKWKHCVKLFCLCYLGYRVTQTPQRGPEIDCAKTQGKPKQLKTHCTFWQTRKCDTFWFNQQLAQVSSYFGFG